MTSALKSSMLRCTAGFKNRDNEIYFLAVATLSMKDGLGGNRLITPAD